MKTLYFFGERGEILLTIPSRLVRGFFHTKKIAKRLSAGHKGGKVCVVRLVER